jgi:large subunit ribosomal protein L4
VTAPAARKLQSVELTTLKAKGKGAKVSLELPKPDRHVLHTVVQWQLAGRRRGTASTKTRGEINLTSKKVWKQKGTGRARHGSRRAPIFVGGGVTFGPRPRDFSYTLPKRVRKLGLQMAFADRAADGKVILLDGALVTDGKTKSFLAWAKKQGLDGSETVLLCTDDELAVRAARNLPWVTARKVAGLNVYDVLRHDRLVMDVSGLGRIADHTNEAVESEGSA